MKKDKNVTTQKVAIKKKKSNGLRKEFFWCEISTYR